MDDAPPPDAPRFRRLEALFHAAAALPDDERAAYLDAHCADDAALRAEVEELLELRPRAERFLDAAPDALPRVEGFELERVLGEGGMGVVYLARQQRPARRVALKLARAQLVDGRHRERLEREAEALARLTHPDIATLYGVGALTTSAGERPYLVMEYVEGEPLDAYAERAGLDLAQRLELVARVADAVQHAHVRGLVHRDLKPDNVLVDAEGRPRVLDFGIARVLDDEGVASAALTRHGDVLGTLAFMSPEQLGGDPNAVDTRSDVYALGVIAYQLVTGAPPLALRELSLGEAVRRVLEQPPVPPSRQRAGIGRDLETVLLHALHKDKDARYAGAAAFADDLRRAAAGEPVSARSPTSFEQLQRLVRRHRALSAAALVALLALGVGGALALVARGEAREEARLARQAEALAERRAEEAQAARRRAETDAARADTARAWLRDTLLLADPFTSRGEDLRVSELFLRALEQPLPDDPVVAADVLDATGRGLRGRGEQAAALQALERAWTLRRAQLGDGHVDTLASLRALGAAASAAGEFERGAAWLRELIVQRTAQRTAQRDAARGTSPESALAAQPADPSAGHDKGTAPDADALTLALADDLDALGDLLLRAGELDAGVDAHERAHALRDPLLPAGHPDRAAGLLHLGRALQARGDDVGARAPLLDALEILRALERPPLETLDGVLETLTQIESSGGNGDTALAYAEERERRLAELLGEEHPVYAAALNELATALLKRGREREARPHFERALAIFEATLGPRHLNTVILRHNLADLLAELDEVATALPLQVRLVGEFRELLGEQHPIVAAALNNLGMSHWLLGDARAALPQLDAALALRREVLPAGHPDLGGLLERVAMVRLDAGEPEAARAAAAEARALLDAHFGRAHWRSAVAETLEGRALAALGRASEAEALLRGAWERLRAGRPPDARLTVEALDALLELLTALGRDDEVAALEAQRPDGVGTRWPNRVRVGDP